MNNFGLLSPSIQHCVVNTLGWKSLRPFQDELIPSILEGKNHIVLAPTAGGKTEAAFFPLLSRAESESWKGVSILYICPLKALLNNMHDRLVQYSSFVGRRAGVWHGDIPVSEKNAILREPTDILMITPESLEAILISTQKDHVALLRDVKALVVDEIHAFAGDDRGWHMQFVIQRILNFSNHHKIQRLGLSASVGNPIELMDWLDIGEGTSNRVYLPKIEYDDSPEITIDFVGNLSNAATVIAGLHRGEKRLVFIDSRAGAEDLGSSLREKGVDVFVTHGSLSREQRMQSEEAFAQRSNCVIVATRVLELGVDIGSLDRVIQIDAPSDVAGFLQRMGRTGRREGTNRNCLFLSQTSDSLLKTLALYELWREGFVEPAVPPPNPLHIAAQQIMAIVLQNNGIGRSQIFEQLRSPLAFANICKETFTGMLDWMLDHEILFDDSGIISMGAFGERTFGKRNFIELMSVFCTPPLFTIRHGRQDVGYVDQQTFQQHHELPWYVVLAGRYWQVKTVDWKRRIAFVEPSKSKGRSNWLGVGPKMSFELCQSYKNVITSSFVRSAWSKRVKDRVEGLRKEYYWVSPKESVLIKGKRNMIEWWTFAGDKGNALLCAGLRKALEDVAETGPYHVRFDENCTFDRAHEAIQSLQNLDWTQIRPAVSLDAIKGLKFRDCLSIENAKFVLESRLSDIQAVKKVLGQSVNLFS